MAKCELCDKSGQSGNNVSHSKRRTKTRWLANIKNTTIYVDGLPKKVKVCTRCLRTQYKLMAKGIPSHQ